MQIIKDDIRRNILRAAQMNFFKKGVRRTSMNDIAQDADVAVGNIYNYFKNKDAIFCEICRPVTEALDKYLVEEVKRTNNQEFYDDKMQEEEMANRFISLIKRYRNELKLLMYESHGTSLQDFFKKYAEAQAVLGKKNIENINKKYPQTNHNISPYFIQVSCKMWYNILEIMVCNENITEDEIRLLVSNYTAFGTAGWKRLLEI